MSEFTASSEHLWNEAIRLTSHIARPAIPIGRIAYQEGVFIERDFKVPHLRSYLILPQNKTDWARVLLPQRARPSARTRSFDRFCLAHELSHLLLIRKFGQKPSFSEKYWEYESICDDFARRLLVPDHFVLNDKDQFDLIDYSTLLSNACKLPWMHAARRVSDHYVDSRFFAVSVLGCTYKIRSSSLPEQRETNVRLRGFLRFSLDRMIIDGTKYLFRIADGHQLKAAGFKHFQSDACYAISINQKKLPNSDFALCISKIPASEIENYDGRAKRKMDFYNQDSALV